jgi:isopentenyldiphosphate isomerase
MSDELIEIFNVQMEMLGVRRRSEVHSLGFWHRGVHCFLFNSSGKLLVQRRSNNCDSFPNTFDCSISEHLSIGESFEGALVRGCLEELGAAPYEINKLVSYKMQYGPTDNMICELYSGRINTDEVKINEAEVAGIEYLDVSEILMLLKARPSQFTSWFREQLYWFDSKPHGLSVI